MLLIILDETISEITLEPNNPFPVKLFNLLWKCKYNFILWILTSWNFCLSNEINWWANIYNNEPVSILVQLKRLHCPVGIASYNHAPPAYSITPLIYNRTPPANYWTSYIYALYGYPHIEINPVCLRLHPLVVIK